MEQAVIIVHGRLAQRVREEAERIGMSSDEYLVELLSQGLDPEDEAREYIEAAKELLEEARKELGKGDVRQAAGKTWGLWHWLSRLMPVEGRKEAYQSRGAMEIY